MQGLHGMGKSLVFSTHLLELLQELNSLIFWTYAELSLWQAGFQVLGTEQ